MTIVITILMWIMYGLGAADIKIDTKANKGVIMVLRIIAIFLPVLVINLMRKYGV